MSERSVLVFGAGPAGLVAALSAATQHARVTLVEKTGMIGRKLSLTGNGRGNLSAVYLTKDCYNEEAGARMERWLRICPQTEVIRLFERIGLYTRTEGAGIYPVSGQASSIVTALHDACLKQGVTILTGAQLKSVEQDGNGLCCVAGGQTMRADAMILSTGGLAGPKTCQASGDAYYLCERLGIACVPRRPALVPLHTKGLPLRTGTGVRVRAAVSFYASAPTAEPGTEPPEDRLIVSEFGEVQLTPQGLSGIPVLQASGKVTEALAAGKEVNAWLDLLPELSPREWEERVRHLEEIAEEAPERPLLSLLTGITSQELGRCILTLLACHDAEQACFQTLSAQQKITLWRLFRAFPVEITGASDYTHAQVTAGGVSLNEVDDDLQSIRVPGLYLAGELLDVDGRCGGYNLHWAFMSGMIAGTHAASGTSFIGEAV